MLSLFMKLNVLYFDMLAYMTSLSIFISFAVIFMLILLLMNTHGAYLVKSESSLIEFVWTVIPTLWVIMLCFLNVKMINNDIEGMVKKSVKIMGRQWYWSYEYGDNSYDSLMLSLINNVDYPLQLSYGVPSRLLITSSDVLHSFSVPDLGMKLDAMPGRVNQVVVTPDRVGSFMGYCSELCGTGHSYMPMVVEVVDINLLSYE